jgi:catechol-2,3-dioxygenase
MSRIMLGALVLCLAGLLAAQAVTSAATTSGDAPLRLGKFSVSLAVKDIAASRAFYEKLGFHVVSGEQAQNWLVLENETSAVGLFRGCFPGTC